MMHGAYNVKLSYIQYIHKKKPEQESVFSPPPPHQHNCPMPSQI